jgi:hypothetical protein
MRERASSIEGKLQLWSSPDNGTEIEISVPGRRAYRFSRRPVKWLHRVSRLWRYTEGDGNAD